MSFVAQVLWRLGLIREDPSIAAQDAAPQPPTDAVDAEPEPTPSIRRLTLADLLAEQRERAASRYGTELFRTAGLDTPFADVFAAAGIAAPAHGWTADRAAEFLESEALGGMDAEVAVRTLHEAVRKDGAEARDLALDAVARDEALDAHEARVAASVDAALNELDAQDADARARIDALRETLSHIAEQRQAVRERLSSWQAEKREAERRWERLLVRIAPLLAAPGQTGSDPAGGAGSPGDTP